MKWRGLVLGLAAVLLILGGLRQLARSRTTQLFGELVQRIETTQPMVALTFDDGPVGEKVDEIIELLHARRVRATFFVIGNQLAEVPDAGRRLVEAGHELGNHSYSHDRLVLKSPGFIRDQIERTDSLIRATGQQGQIYFRAPFTWKLVVLPWYLWRTGRTTITCDIEPDSYPEVAASPEGIVAHVLERTQPGSIILLHVWYPGRATSLAAVPQIIDELHGRGYRFVTVSELLKESARQEWW